MPILHLPRTLLVALVLSTPALFAAENNINTQARLEKYGKELAEAWEKFPTEAQKATRTQTITDINALFSREMQRADPPKDKKLLQIFSSFMASLERTTEYFRVEKMKSERSSYIKGCSQTFKRETAFATDYLAERTTQKCYDMLLDLLEQVRDKFVMEKDKDLRNEGIQAVNSFFNELMQKAKIPDGDHATMMDKNIKEAKTRFPMTTEAMKTKNQPIFAVCESAAKAIKTKANQKQN